MRKMRIIKYNEKFKEEVIGLLKQYLYSEFQLDPKIIREDIRDIEGVYKPPRSIFLIGLEAGQVIATGGLKEVSQEEAELKRLFIKTAYRRKGLGSAMLQRLINFAKKQGFQRVVLNTLRTNIPSIELYKKHDFKEISSFYRPTSIDPERLLFLAKEI